jgi:indolepyruvate ferredoxin oxidoreductase
VAANLRAFAWGRLAAHDLPAVEAAARPALRESQAAGVAEELDAIVARRVAFLTEYQNARYAEAYRARVERVAARESKVAPGSTRLARAVARYYFKLLAVKDEFEVARLYTDGSFQRQLAAEFEGDYRMYVHFAPPFAIPVIDWLTERRDPETGRMRKWRIPARWFLPLLSVLAAFKFLRGTPLNLFGRTAHRRLEQQLRRDYEATLDQLLEGLGERNLDIAVEIASLPEHVRGFEQVREAHIDKVRAKQDELLAAWRLHS